MMRPDGSPGAVFFFVLQDVSALSCGDPALVGRADFSKTSLQSRVFTGVGAEDQKNTNEDVLTPSRVDWKKTDFIDLEASSIAAKQNAAKERENVVVKPGAPGS